MHLADLNDGTGDPVRMRPQTGLVWVVFSCPLCQFVIAFSIGRFQRSRLTGEAATVRGGD